MATATAPATMTGRAAYLRLGVSYAALLKYATLGRVRTVAEPGRAMRFNADDVEKLARELGR
jgi:predicted site-specific integrase-resolvase